MSILSYPDRGKWGKRSWRGNCSGRVYKEIFERLTPKIFVDPMVGSGTSVEVAREMGIESFGLDLHSGFNAVRQSILEAVGKRADLVVSHPPYGAMIVYSGEVWGDAAHPDDLSRCIDDEDFHQKMQLVLLNQREATVGGGYYGTIIGDWRRGGVYTSYQAEMIARMPKSELAAVLIKAQHNTLSSSKSYGNMKLPFILHEYILLWQKKSVPMLSMLQAVAQQQYARLTGTWVNVVKMALISAGGKASLGDLYTQIERAAPERLATNQHWREKVRQTLNRNSAVFKPIERGVWAVA
jgi:hypothetical protein